MGQFSVERKVPPKAVSLNRLKPMQTYKVVEIRPGGGPTKYFDVGDTVIFIQPPNMTIGQGLAINLTKDLTVMNTASGTSYAVLFENVMCLRDYTVKSVMLMFDDNDLPA